MRFTRRNPDGETYRVWMDQAGDFQIKCQGGELFAFGDLINALGRFEDKEEDSKKPRKATRKR